MKDCLCLASRLAGIGLVALASACGATPTAAPGLTGTPVDRPVSSSPPTGAPTSGPSATIEVDVIAGLPPTPSPVAPPAWAYPPPQPGAFDPYPAPVEPEPSATVPPEYASETAVAADRAATATAIMAAATPTAPIVIGAVDLVFAAGSLRLRLPDEWQAAPDASGVLLGNYDLSLPDQFSADAPVGRDALSLRLDLTPLRDGRSPEAIEAAWQVAAQADLRAGQTLDGPLHFQTGSLIGRAYVTPLQAIGRIDRVLTIFVNLGDGRLLTVRIVPFDSPGYPAALDILSSLVLTGQ